MVNMWKRGSDKRDSDKERSLGREGNKVYVSNIDFSSNHVDIKNVFNQVGEVAFVEMIKDDNQRSKGCAIVRFRDSNMAEKAIQMMNRYEMNGRKIVVKSERDGPRDSRSGSGSGRKRFREDENMERSFPPPPPNPPMSGHNPENDNNTYGLSMSFLQSLGIELPLVNRIFVANLDYTVTEEKLKELFSICGNVIDIELVHGDDGKIKGYGFIEFEHPIEAVQAISMLHNQVYLNRTINVQITRKERRKDGPIKLPSGLKGIGMGLGVNGTPLKNVARSMEAGNQASILGALPCSPNMAPFAGQMNPMGFQPAMNPAMAMGGAMMPNPMMPGMMATVPNNMNPAGMMDNGTSTFGVGGGFNQVISNQGMNQASSRSNASGQRTIQISNLPNNYTWKSLQDLCSSFGEVGFAKITSPGVGIVHFSSESSAQTALEMLDNQRFEGQYLVTKFV